MRLRRDRFEAIGTRWVVTISSNLSDADWRFLRGAIQGRIAEFDHCYSRFRADSLVSQMAERAGRYELPPDAYALLHLYEHLYRATDGLVTPLIGQTLVDAGYDAEYSLRAKAPAAPPAWDDVITYDEHSITLRQPALLDFGAAGKGYLVDLVSELLLAAGVHAFTINAGGDIVHRGAPITVGLENPLEVSEAIGTTELNNQSLCASSGSRRTWGDYHHIINPKTLSSPRDILATWVLADNGLLADGLATALFLVPPTALHEFRFGCAIFRADMSLEQINFPAKVFTAA